MENQAKKRTVLIVDDTPMNRVLLADILGPDYTVIEAATGEEAVDILTARWTDIALFPMPISLWLRK